MTTRRAELKRCMFSAIIGFAAVTAAIASAVGHAAPPPLVKVADYTLQESRVGAAAVVRGDYLYVIGGSDGREPTRSAARTMQLRNPEDAGWRTRNPGGDPARILDSIERVDLRTGEVQLFGRLRHGRVEHNAVAIDGVAWVIGGRSVEAGDALFDKSIEVVDLETGEVRDGPADLPDPRMRFGCVELAGEVYVIGGMRLKGATPVNTNTVQVLNVQTGRWSDGLPMPTPRQCDATVVDGGFIVVPGGFNGKRGLTEVEVYDPRNRAWRTLPPLSRMTSAHSVAFLGRYLFLFGDYQEPGTALVYDLVQKQSQRVELKPSIGRHSTAVAHGRRLYVIGGKEPGAPEASNRIQVFELTPTPG